MCFIHAIWEEIFGKLMSLFLTCLQHLYSCCTQNHCCQPTYLWHSSIDAFPKGVQQYVRRSGSRGAWFLLVAERVYRLTGWAPIVLTARPQVTEVLTYSVINIFLHVCLDAWPYFCLLYVRLSGEWGLALGSLQNSRPPRMSLCDIFWK